MNRHILLPLYKKWIEMMNSGEKLYEFRNDRFKKGDAIELYEAKGKRLKGQCTGVCDEECKSYYESAAEGGYQVEQCTKRLKPIYDKIHHEGSGLVVAKFVVGMVSELLSDDEFVSFRNKDSVISNSYYYKSRYKTDLELQGYTNQKYAIEITNFEMYDTPKKVTEFIGWNKLEKKIKNTQYNDINIDCMLEEGYQELLHDIERGIFECDACMLNTGFGNTPSCIVKFAKEDNLFLTSHPQGKIFVVGDEQCLRK